MGEKYSSIFGELTKSVQARIDAASQLRKLLFSKTYYEDRLDWDTPTVGLNFEEIIGEYGLSIAAATIGDNGKEPIRPFNGLETLNGKVFNHAHTIPMDINQYRKVLELMNSKLLSDEQLKSELIKVMFGNVTDVVNGVKAKIDMMFLGALSNEGIYTFDETTNPEGGQRGTVDYKMPDENKATVKTDWTASNIDKVDVFEDIQAMQEAYADKSPIAEIWLSQSKLNFILRNKAMKQVIFGTDRKNNVLLLSNLNEFMQLNGLPIFKVIKRQVNILDKNGMLNAHTPFNGKNLVFVPDGKLGVIKNAYANNELKPEQGVAYSNEGRIRISQWGVGEKEGSNGVEFTKAQVFALPAITAINGIYSLKTEK